MARKSQEFYEQLANEYLETQCSLTYLANREGIDRGNLSKRFKKLGI